VRRRRLHCAVSGPPRRESDFKLRSGGGGAAVRLDELRRLKAVDAPSPEERARIALLEAGEAADQRAVADSKLAKGVGLAAVRLDELRRLKAVDAPSPEERAVLDQHDLIERNARLNTFRTKPTFNIVVTRGNTFYISNGTKELQIGSIHTNKGPSASHSVYCNACGCRLVQRDGAIRDRALPPAMSSPS
jgi:hypothetical protein